MSNLPEKRMYEDPNLVKIVTVTGYVDCFGRFWGNDENMARYSSCTHRTCECGNEMDRGYTICAECHSSKAREKYAAMPLAVWDGVGALYSNTWDLYFLSAEEVLDFADDGGVTAESLELIICEPVIAQRIDDDYWQDDLPEDQDINEIFSAEIMDLLAKLNALLSKQIISWRPGKYRTSVASAQGESS